MATEQQITVDNAPRIESRRNARAPRASDVAYERLLQMILHVTLAPGALVDERSLATELDSGRMPVREAIARLSGEGFVEVLPRRGAVITPVGRDLVREVYDARSVIECGTAHLAAQRITDAQIGTLRGLIAEAEEARTAHHVDEFLAADQPVHKYLVDINRNSVLCHATDRMLKHTLRLWHFYFSVKRFQSSSLISHQALLLALEHHDPEAAREAMLQHISDSRAVLQGLF